LFRRYSSLKFSDRSNSNSNVVRYTSFNDSKLPFKDLQNNDGAVFFLLNQNDSIFCIQRLKCSSIPVARNILSDALGNETVIATAKVLGTEKYYAGAYGTDSAPSVAQAGNSIYFVSIRNKEVYRFNPNSGIEIISDKGMGSFFNEALAVAELGAGRVVGGYDPDSDEFVLSINDPVFVLTADFSGIPYSNAVSTLSADDYVGFEADTGSGVDVNEDFEAITDLVNQIDGLTSFIDSNDEAISDFIDDLSSLDDLIASDFTETAFAGETITVNVGDTSETIGPSSIPAAYTTALQAIRDQVIFNIAQLMESKISSLVSLGEARNQIVQNFLSSAVVTEEAAQTFDQLESAITTLENGGFQVVPDYLSQEQRDDLSSFNDFSSDEIETLSQNSLLPITGASFDSQSKLTPDLSQIFNSVLVLSPELFSVVGAGVFVPDMFEIAFVEDVLFSDYVSDVQDLFPDASSFPEISDLIPSIINAVSIQAAQDVDITTDNLTPEEIEALETAAYNEGVASVDITSDNQDVADAAYADGLAVGQQQSSDAIDTLNADLALSEKRLQIITRSLIVLGNVIDVANNFNSDDVINSFGESLQDFVSFVDTENDVLIEDIDAAYNSISSGNPTDFLLDTLLIFPTSGSSSPFVQVMNQAIRLAYDAIPNPAQFTQLTDFMTGNSDFLRESGAITEASLLQTGEGNTNRARVTALGNMATVMASIAWSLVTFGDSGAAQPQNLGLLAEFLSAWITLGQRINLEAPGTIDLTPTTPQGLLDANTTFTLTGDNGEPVGSITFDQLVNIFRKGLISENQAKLIFKGLMGPKSSGGVSAYTSSNTIHAFDSNFDNEIGSADLLDFLIVFGREAVQEQNFQQFGNVEFTGENLASGYAEVVPIPNTSDSAPFLEDDVDAINIQGL
jgi:hypothetical protein